MCNTSGFSFLPICWRSINALVTAAFLLAATNANGQAAPDLDKPLPRETAVRVLRLDLFVRPDSELCAEAVSVAEEFCKSRGGVELVVHDVVAKRAALDQYWKLATRFRVQKPVLPAFYACHDLKMGFAVKEGDSRLAELFAIHAYIRPGCQHCRDATDFLNNLAKRWIGVRVVYHDVVSDRIARDEMSAAARRHGVTVASLPGIVVCGRYIAGYQSDASTGREIEELLWQASTIHAPLDSAHGAIRRGRSSVASHMPANWDPSAPGRPFLVRTALAISGDEPPPNPDALPLSDDVPLPDEGAPPLPSEGAADEGVYALPEQTKDEITVPWFGRVSLHNLGLPLFTLAIGLIDGFNPCAMWVLVFLLSVLVNVKDRRKIAAIAGTFVLVSGVVYFAFMAAWLNLFLVIDLARPLQIAIGLLALVIGVINVKDFFAFKRGVTLSIPESAKPGIYDRVRRIVTTKYLSVAVGLSVVLAMLVNVVELLCTAGLPALYTQILSQQQLPTWQNYAYLALYNVGYIFDDSLMVGAFIITLSHRKMREDEGRWLKLLSGVVVLALGVVVLFKPEWLQWG
jgi:glutaredoxin